MLNRIVRRVKPQHGSGRERIEYEADPRHAEYIIHQVELSSSSRSASTSSENSKPGVDHSTVSGEHTLYRSAPTRLCDLALDRPDFAVPIKGTGTLDASARYLIGHGRLIQDFVREIEEPSHGVHWLRPRRLPMVLKCYVPPAPRKESTH